MLASVAGGTRNQACGAWLTGGLVAQVGQTPLHYAAYQGEDEAIDLLLHAFSDIRTKDKVRWGEGEKVLGGRAGGGGLTSSFY